MVAVPGRVLSPIETRASPHVDKTSPTIYTIASMTCMLALSFMLGSRSRHLRLNNISRMNFVRQLVVLMYILGIMFIVALAILSNGLDIKTYADCHAAIVMCLAFYMGSKLLLYLFLVERAHVIRAPSTRRLSDKVWLTGMAIVCLGFGALSVVGFMWPVAQITDGQCRVGLLPRVTIPIISFDIVINIGFTVLFIRLLWPLLSFHSKRASRLGLAATSSSSWHRRVLARSRPQQDQPAVEVRGGGGKHNVARIDVGNTRLLKVLRKLVFKTVVGGVLVMVPTTANLVLLFRWEAHEPGWMCATICSLDVTWSIVVVHWLTVDPADLDGSIDLPNGGGKTLTTTTTTTSPPSPSSSKYTTTTSRLSRSSNNSVRIPPSPSSPTARIRRPSSFLLAIPGACAAPLAKSLTVVTAASTSDAADEGEQAPFGAVRKRTSISQSSLREPLPSPAMSETTSTTSRSTSTMGGGGNGSGCESEKGLLTPPLSVEVAAPTAAGADARRATVAGEQEQLGLRPVVVVGPVPVPGSKGRGSV
ncbi:hypothetical protein SLS58_008714 [Diplodia intermedia]|uniref:Uncharacterized protein n=1 Tax=Diplodia intermedia TaxID=856260 RepID=A0ABR3TGU0_9PEZI